MRVFLRSAFCVPRSAFPRCLPPADFIPHSAFNRLHFLVHARPPAFDSIRHSGFVIDSDFGFRHSDLPLPAAR